MDILDSLSENVLKDLELLPLLINLVLVLLLCQLLSWHYQRFSKVLSNKRKFSRLFVFIGATTMMVISVVKSSLALSLGLVGALSIIRFRTPIKEPEDLAYLFLALATGIGLGADQRLPTCIMFAGIMIAITLIRYFRGGKDEAPRLYLHVSTPLKGASKEGIETLLESVRETTDRMDLRRVDTESGVMNATLLVDLDESQQIGGLISRIEAAFPDASVSVVEGATLE